MAALQNHHSYRPLVAKGAQGLRGVLIIIAWLLPLRRHGSFAAVVRVASVLLLIVL